MQKGNDKLSGITCITPTGDRPEAFERCKFYMDRQTRQPDQWIVIDNGKDAIRPPEGAEYRRLSFKRQRGYSIAESYILGVNLAKYNKIFFFEDDDWYARTYLKIMAPYLKKLDLVGIFRNRYYNVKDKYFFVNGNFHHSSLCSTCISSRIIPTFLKVAELHRDRNWKYIDLKLWMRKELKRKLLRDNYICVGIKGMPGRVGMAGHYFKEKYLKEKDYRHLYKWLPKEDADWYVRFFQNKNSR